MFEPKFISFESQAECLDLAGASILIDVADFEGLKIAAKSLADDLEKVTGQTSRVLNDISNIHVKTAIILGTLERSRQLQKVVDNGKLETSEIEGKWESFTTNVVENPLNGVGSALVLAGSDKRGAIFAAYTLSEQIGVSPCEIWYLTFNINGLTGQ